MAKCKGSKCKSAADCDDCVVKAARKASAKKTKERNAMLLLKAKILEKMPKAAPVDPFASYRSLPQRQKIYQPSAKALTLQNVADEIERAFARRDRPSTLEKPASVKQSFAERSEARSEAPSGFAAPTLESYVVIPSFAAPTLESYEVIPRRGAKMDFGIQTEPPRRELTFEPQVSSLREPARVFPEAPSLEEAVMDSTAVGEFDDEDAMEALDEAMAPGAAALAESTEALDEMSVAERSGAPSGFAAPGAAALSASTEARTLSIEEPMGPWVQELESKVKPIVFPLRASGVYTAPYEPPDIGAETARAMVYGDLEKSGFTSAILESAGGAALEPEMGPFFQTIAESGLKPVKSLKNTGREGVAMDSAMELKEAIPPIQTAEERKRAARRAKSAAMSEEEKLIAKKERQSKKDAKAAAKSLAESYGEAVFEGSAYKPTFTEEAGEIFDVEL